MQTENDGNQSASSFSWCSRCHAHVSNVMLSWWCTYFIQLCV